MTRLTYTPNTIGVILKNNVGGRVLGFVELAEHVVKRLRKQCLLNLSISILLAVPHHLARAAVHGASVCRQVSGEIEIPMHPLAPKS